MPIGFQLATLLQKRLWHGCFSLNLAKFLIFKNTSLIEKFQATTSKTTQLTIKNHHSV